MVERTGKRRKVVSLRNDCPSEERTTVLITYGITLTPDLIVVSPLDGLEVVGEVIAGSGEEKGGETTGSYGSLKKYA